MITFSETIMIAQQTVADSGIMEKLEEVTIIRDVKGKIRLLLDAGDNALTQEDLSGLGALLEARLDTYYGQEVWVADRSRTVQDSLVRVIVAERRGIEWQVPAQGNVSLYLLERHIAKKTWTSSESNDSIWSKQLVDDGHKPAIISFYSFKGGSGRTTTLTATAINLSRMGFRVAIVDFDLEAPGAGSIFFSPDTISYGTIDYLLEKPVQGRNWSIQMQVQTVNDQNIIGDDGEPITLIPAGIVNDMYLEKLARLDFQGITENGMSGTIESLLKELAASRKLDFILIDSRAGFHDIGGMALTRMAHAAVLFGVHSEQTWAGLSFAIRKASNLHESDPMPVVMIHALAPSYGVAGREGEIRAFRDRSYDLFLENYYRIDEVASVNSNNADEPFYPIVVPYDDLLRGEFSLRSNEDVFSESSSFQIGRITEANGPYRQLATRLIRIFEKDEELG